MEEKALDLRNKYLGRDLVEVLTEATPKDWIKERPIRGGKSASYIEGYHFTQKLNDCFGFLWSYDVIEAFEKDGHIVVKGQLSVQIPGKRMTRELPDGTKEVVEVEGLVIKKTQYGGAEIKKFTQAGKNYKAGDMMDLADDYKAAATDAMKKCCLALGMFLDIYGPREDSESGPSKAQTEAFYMRATNAGMDQAQADEWCTKETGKKPESLDPLELMGLIPKLIDLAKVKGGN